MTIISSSTAIFRSGNLFHNLSHNLFLYTPYFSTDCALYYFILCFCCFRCAGQKCRALATLLPLCLPPPTRCNYANFCLRQRPGKQEEVRQREKEREREAKQKNGKSGNEMFFTHECERMHLPPKQWQGRGMTTRRQEDKVGRPLKVFSTFDGNGFVVALLLSCWSRGKCGKFMETIFRC